MTQLTMNLNKATADDILDVSQGMANGRNKVDIIKRRVGRRNHGATSYESANIVAEQLQKVICYQKRRGVWKIPTQSSLYCTIRNMVLKGEISSARSEDVQCRGITCMLVSYNEVRRHLLDRPKYDLQANREHGGIEVNPKFSKIPKPPTLLSRLIRWLKMFKEVV